MATKILDLIPENLRKQLESEVLENAALDDLKSAMDKKGNIAKEDPSKVDEVIKNWADTDKKPNQ